jgi:RNA-directed DNA polymerase
MEGRGVLTMAPIRLQDLRRRLYVKAKADKDWRFWGLYVHVAKLETLQVAYDLVKRNSGAPGIDGVTFEAIEAVGVDTYLAQLRDELTARTYRPLRNRRVEIPKDDGKKVRVLGIPAIRDRVVQGALKLILEPIFEAGFHDGSYGYRPKRTAHAALARVTKAILGGKTQVIDLDLAAYFDTVRHDLLVGKVARRIQDGEILHLLTLMLKASGKRGVPQGGVISPLLSNIYLTEVDAMLERAKAVTREGMTTHVEYARYADDLVILVNGQWRGGGVWILGLHLPTAPLEAGPVVGVFGAGPEEADGVGTEAPGGVPALALSAGEAGDRGDQPDLEGLGELLPGRQRGAVLQHREELGREEGTAPHDAGEGPTGLRLEAVE